MRDICIIPARGGSKRLPGKNIKDFAGKPIIAYSIEAALTSGLFDEVMVSTDDPYIAEIAEKFGANVPFFRSEKNADEHATTADVLEEVLVAYLSLGKKFKKACCLYPTAPLITQDSLEKGKDLLNQSDADTVFPVVRFGYPVWRGLRKDGENNVEMIWKEHVNTRSQDLEDVFHDAGQWYWFDVKRFLKNKKLFTDNSKVIELSPLEVQDIDNVHDWRLVELKYVYLQSFK